VCKNQNWDGSLINMLLYSGCLPYIGYGYKKRFKVRKQSDIVGLVLRGSIFERVLHIFKCAITQLLKETPPIARGASFAFFL
jgi:hypothetical protein